MAAASAMTRLITCWIAYLAFSILCLVTAVDSSPGEDRLLIELFETRHYNRLSNPIRNVNETIYVQLSIVFVKVVEVDEIQEVIRSTYWNRIRWRDYRLTWNISDFDSVTQLYIPVSDIWVPDIILWNNAKSDVETGGKSLKSDFIQVDHTGLCWWFPFQDDATAHCPMDIRWFPFDDQKCPIILESWKMDSQQLNLTMSENPVSLIHYQTNGEWELIDIPYSLVGQKYSCCEAPFSRIIFTIHLRRKSMYYIINLVIPCCIFSVLAVVTFLLPPTCGERIGLGITILLALSVYQTIVNDKLPTTSDAVPALGIYFLLVMVMCGVSVAVTMAAMYFHNRHSRKAPMPLYVKRIVCGCLASVVCMKPAPRPPPFPVPVPVPAASNIQSPHLFQNSTNPEETTSPGNKTSDPSDKSSTTYLLHRNSHLVKTTINGDQSPPATAAAAAAETAVVEINLVNDGDNETEDSDEWLTAASVVDRFCCWIVALTLCLGNIGILVLPFIKHLERP